jgi:hypothetical protein
VATSLAAWLFDKFCSRRTYMPDLPFQFTLPFPALIPSKYDGYIQRKLSSLRGQFLDSAAYEKMITVEDTLVYEVYEIHRPEVAGEVLSGISIVHPGRVGNEFFMTKGHFHTVLETAEIYMCLKGEGFMVMETPEGETCVEALGCPICPTQVGSPFGLHFAPAGSGDLFCLSGPCRSRLRNHRTPGFWAAGPGICQWWD